MDTPARHLALGIDIDEPFQRVLAAWLATCGLRTLFLPLAGALRHAGPVDLVVCELAEPKRRGAATLHQLAHAHPRASLLAISSSFVAGARGDALARQLGAHAALAKPFSRYDLQAALQAAAAMPQPAPHA
jgi:CheY-like chemotaxis protein